MLDVLAFALADSGSGPPGLANPAFPIRPTPGKGGSRLSPIDHSHAVRERIILPARRTLATSRQPQNPPRA